MTETFTCPACGYPDLSEPPRLPGGGASYEICWSCGFEYGVTDDDEDFTYESWRHRWIEQGMPWTSEGLHPRPDNWDPRKQLDNIAPAADQADERS